MDAERQEGGRINQKRRTRVAIVEAAARLIERGLSPSIADVADEAGVSRATAYRYFPSQELLLTEAALHATTGPIDAVVAALQAEQDAARRVDAVVRVIQQMVVEREAQFRLMLRLMLEGREGVGQPDIAERSVRGGRRLRWFAEALAPAAGQIDDTTREKLIAGLSLCVGIDAFVVLRDICGLSVEEAEDVSRWAAQALVQAALAESGRRSG